MWVDPSGRGTGRRNIISSVFFPKKGLFFFSGMAHKGLVKWGGPPRTSERKTKMAQISREEIYAEIATLGCSVDEYFAAHPEHRAVAITELPLIGAPRRPKSELEYALSYAKETSVSVVISDSSKEKLLSDSRRGRASSLAGKTLWMSEKTLIQGNTRRVGSFGWVSMEVIIKDPGITYEDFIRDGGRSVDLRWDIEHGNAIAI